MKFSRKTLIWFWARLDKNGPIFNRKFGRCWIWKTLRPWSPGKGFRGPQRLAFQIQNGSISKGKWILHRCPVTNCLRGSHIYAGTPSENIKDGWRKRKAKKLMVTC